jgi:hypothetical protein
MKIEPVHKIMNVKKQKKAGCGCGRSPIGRCVGWHKLSEERYMEVLEKYNAMPESQKMGYLSPKAIDGFGE